MLANRMLEKVDLQQFPKGFVFTFELVKITRKSQVPGFMLN